MSETNAGRALGAVFYGGVELAFVVAHLHRADRSRAHQAHRFDGSCPSTRTSSGSPASQYDCGMNP